MQGAFISGLAGAYDVVTALDLPEGSDDNAKPTPGQIQPDVQNRRRLEREAMHAIIEARRELSNAAACPLAHGQGEPMDWLDSDEGRVWEATWKERFDSWWIATPYKEGLSACFGESYTAPQFLPICHTCHLLRILVTPSHSLC